MNHGNNLNENDVLCGRGGGTNNNKGNILFRQMVASRQLSYLKASNQGKKSIAKAIVDEIRQNGGRFLKCNDRGESEDIGDVKAGEKTRQALREGMDIRNHKKEKDDFLRAEHERDSQMRPNAYPPYDHNYYSQRYYHTYPLPHETLRHHYPSVEQKCSRTTYPHGNYSKDRDFLFQVENERVDLRHNHISSNPYPYQNYDLHNSHTYHRRTLTSTPIALSYEHNHASRNFYSARPRNTLSGRHCHPDLVDWDHNRVSHQCEHHHHRQDVKNGYHREQSSLRRTAGNTSNMIEVPRLHPWDYYYGASFVHANKRPRYEGTQDRSEVSIAPLLPRDTLKSQSSIHFERNNLNETRNGCKCKKIQCIKKYCECFSSGIKCGKTCQCLECKNN